MQPGHAQQITPRFAASRARVYALPGAAASVFSLKGNECCWPVGTVGDEDFRFCCAPALPEAEPRYCAEHLALHGSGKTTRRAASRQGKLLSEAKQ